MTETEVTELLENISLVDLKKHINNLNEIGIITDASDPRDPLFPLDHTFPHMVIKNWKISHKEYLSEHGYKGCDLKTGFVKTSNNNLIYIIYDSNKYNPKSAIEYAREQEIEDSKIKIAK